MTRQTAAIILAAGKGTRMESDLPKVLFPLLGRSLLDHVLDSVMAAGFDRTVVIVGHQADRVREAVKDRDVRCALQEPQLGTGHAVQCAMPELEGFAGDLAVLAGAAPLIRPATLKAMMRRHQDSRSAVTILTAMLPDATGYGRILRDAAGTVTGIVEHRDATEAQRQVREINSSIYAFDAGFLAGALPRLKAANDQAEYYLTDTVAMAVGEGLRVEGVVVEDHREVLGINTREHLEEARNILESRAG